jgi:quinol monooxygenase YgiN
MATLRVVAHLRAKADKIEETREALTSLVEPTREEAGCIGYELMQNDAEPTDFTFVEEWSTGAALDAHLESKHIRDLRSRADELFAAPPDVRRYTLLI